LPIWIGGAPGVGKTTVASILARRHGLRLYSADTRTWQHRDRAIAAGNAAAMRWESLSRDDRRRAADDDLIAMSLYLERGAMVVADVRALPDSPLVVAEGSVLRPQDVPPGASALWLLAGPDFQQMHLRERDGDRNRLYELTLDVIAADVRETGARAIQVAEDVATTVSAVEATFADELARGPLASSVDQRRELLREANLEVVEQVRGFYARPWASVDPATVVRTFICECGDPVCVAFVDAIVRDAAVAPVIADRHSGGIANT
jgi:hypothetical protein